MVLFVPTPPQGYSYLGPVQNQNPDPHNHFGQPDTSAGEIRFSHLLDENFESNGNRESGGSEVKPLQPRYFEINSQMTRAELIQHDEERKKKQEQEFGKQFFQISQALSTLSTGSSSNNFLISSVNEWGQHAIDLWWKKRVRFLPDWAKRFEFEWNLRENNKFEFEALTIQPLYQSSNKTKTLFTQISVSNREQFRETRTTTNFGIGYRHLFLDNTLMLGVNGFYDREWAEDHNRTGIGGEVRWNAFDLYANAYLAASKGRKLDDVTREEALDGFDIELTTQVPFLPWARARAKGFFFDTIVSEKNIEGWSTSLEMDLTSNTLVEMGITDDNFNDEEYFIKIRFTIDHKRPTMVSNFVDSKPFRMRDMTEHTLDRVRRENKIILERQTGGSITVSRGT